MPGMCRGGQTSQVHPADYNLKIQASIERKPPCSTCTRDTSEIRRVDIHVGITEIRMVQDVDHIHPKFKIFRFGHPDALDQIHVQPDVAGSNDRVPAKRADLTRSGIHQKPVAVTVLDSPIRGTQTIYLAVQSAKEILKMLASSSTVLKRDRLNHIC